MEGRTLELYVDECTVNQECPIPWGRYGVETVS